ncbi:COBRA-like protein 4 [Diospyros lotus]|uniref:COBRA-like protein 4 n=1 Tax=Diospyros lotus TaxID=55363 RepID=UPI0022573D50|nr:COBRA-like protein 4 [Diospyros lotus]XP_052179954.1 COBRA-like protein 4 [Diospyros lotus]XP_052179955.1 COBRA-like protein 4 [Diospyros lotus]
MFQCQTFAGLKFISSTVILFIIFNNAEAYDSLDPFGNITVRWDIMSWTTDGYMATVTLNNFQLFRHIISPGWTLGWSWRKKEIIWTMVGAQATEQGDCSKFKGNVPHSCSRHPTVVDLLPGAPYNQQYSNCCKGGVLSSWGQDPAAAVAAFQIGVGLSGTSNKTVKLPKNFTLLGPGPGYTCGPAKVVPPSGFLSSDHRRKTRALMTWNVTCTYSQFLASKYPACCVSFSSFYNNTIIPCPSCSCGCQNIENCIKVESDDVKRPELNATMRKDTTPLLQCTHHMCPIRVHWHVKLNYKEYWRAKIAITNFNYRMNYTEWTLVVQHPNLDNVTQVFSFEYKPLLPYQSINDTGMFYGMKFYNDVLMEAGLLGNVQSELLLQKNKETFTLRQGWGFPRKVYFNGEECQLPPPDAYPFLPNSVSRNPATILLGPAMSMLLLIMILSIC